jgi:tetratricopeptide (TPR) repeat protein
MKRCWLCVTGLVVLALGRPVPAQVTGKEERIVDQVAKRLLACMDRPPGYDSWPPRVVVEDQPEPNAFAGLDWKKWLATKEKHPLVTVVRKTVTEISENDPDILALTLAHELGHLHHGHSLRRIGAKPVVDEKTPLVSLRVFTREQEIEADDFGMKLFLKANYPYKAAIRNLLNWKAMSKYTSFEGLGFSHPSWTDRIAMMEKKHQQLWRAMSAFENGVLFLQLEQYQSAEMCFRRMLDELPKKFPPCYEAEANLGYALLMQYCDALRPEDLREFGVGHLVVGGFYRDVKSLEPEIPRGKDRKRWTEAVQHLNTALRYNSTLSLVKANLGLAYLVHPDGKDAKKALQYMQEAVAGKGPDAEFSPLYRLIVLSNTGVAELAAGNLKTCAQTLDRIKVTADKFALGRQARALIDSAMLYNKSLLILADKEARPEDALPLLEKYLQTTPAASSWWPLAHQRYLELCQNLKRTAKPEAELKRRSEAQWRLVTGLEVPGTEGTVSLSAPLAEAKKILGEPQTAFPIIPGTPRYQKLVYPNRGVDLLATDQVVAIVLRGDKAPPLTLRPTGPASKQQTLRIGMSTQELESILGETAPDTALDNPEILYRSYSPPGLLVRILRGAVREIVIVRIPAQQSVR